MSVSCTKQALEASVAVMEVHHLEADIGPSPQTADFDPFRIWLRELKSYSLGSALSVRRSLIA
jgi:hypothetical protein